MTSKQCGTCTACCKLVGVSELDKPAGVACRHIAPGKGCGIYPDRPSSCRGFRCLWLDTEMPDELRPDRSHVVLAYFPEDGSFSAWVAAGHRKAWKREPVFPLLKRMVEKGYRIVITIIGEDIRNKIVFERSGNIAGFHKAKFTAPDAKGEQYEVKLP